VCRTLAVQGKNAAQIDYFMTAGIGPPRIVRHCPG